jgi:NADPH2:quinone reductase
VRAARVHEWGVGPAFEHDAAEPEPGVGETLVAIDAAAVGQLDVQIAAGTFPLRPALPYTPGTDATGRVVMSARFREGTRVWIRGGGVGVARDGCWADRVAVPDEAVHELGVDVDRVIAASFWVPCSTARAAVEDVGGLIPGERVAVRGGAGAVGSIAVQLAVLGGAGEVLAIVRNRRASTPPEVTVLAADDPKLLERLRVDGGIDLFVDTVGGPGLAGFLEAMRPGGRIAVVGYVGGTETALDLQLLLTQDVRLLPVNQIRRQDGLFDSAPALLAQLASGELRLATTAFPFERLPDSVEALRSGCADGRVVLTF